MTIQFHCPKCGSLIAFTDKPIIAMRSIGLFYRHYDCYFGKSW